jgi:hypothetical protein
MFSSNPPSLSLGTIKIVMSSRRIGTSPTLFGMKFRLKLTRSQFSSAKSQSSSQKKKKKMGLKLKRSNLSTMILKMREMMKMKKFQRLKKKRKMRPFLKLMKLMKKKSLQNLKHLKWLMDQTSHRIQMEDLKL